MEAGHHLVELLGQHVHAGRVVLGLGEQLDLGQHLVGERAAHHEARVAGGAAEVEQATLGQHDHRVPVGEHELVDLRLDVHPCVTSLMRSRPAMSISLSKWPMLPTIAWCFIRPMCSAVMMSLLPVAVTNTSAVSMTSSRRATW